MGFPSKIKAVFNQILVITPLLLALWVSGCDGISTKGGASACTGSSAHINVYDNGFQRVCGCSEGSGYFSTPGTLNCTVAYGATVYFYFINTSNTHQVTTSYMSVGSTQVVSPSDSVKVGALIMNQAGSITFSDNGCTALNGTITVTP